MEKLKMFVVQEPVVAASCLIAGFGFFLPAVVRPILDSYQTTEHPPQPALSDVVKAGHLFLKGKNSLHAKIFIMLTTSIPAKSQQNCRGVAVDSGLDMVPAKEMENRQA